MKRNRADKMGNKMTSLKKNLQKKTIDTNI